MDKETAKYIIDYFSHLLTTGEKLAIKHTMSTLKLNSSSPASSTLINIYKERGWLTDDQNILDLLKDGYDNFEINIGNRILKEYDDKVFLNNCPKCGKLTRTPQVRQCRHCRHNWHSLTVAQFKLNESFQLTGRHFILLGNIIKGEIKVGNYIDLTILGLNCKPKIESIEFALKKVDGKASESIGLGINELPEEQKEYLKKCSFGILLDIIKAK